MDREQKTNGTLTGVIGISGGVSTGLTQLGGYAKISSSTELYKSNVKNFLKKGKCITKRKWFFNVTVRPYVSYLKISSNLSGSKIYVYKSGKLAVQK